MSCKCQDCGINYNIDLIVDDCVWERIKPEGKAVGSGLLCGSCIINKLEEQVEVGTIQGTTDFQFKEEKSSMNVYKVEVDGGKLGILDGIFKATEKELQNIIGTRVSFGANKARDFSDMYAMLTADMVTLVSSDPEIVKNTEECGLNPFTFVDRV